MKPLQRREVTLIIYYNKQKLSISMVGLDLSLLQNVFLCYVTQPGLVKHKNSSQLPITAQHVKKFVHTIDSELSLKIT